MIFRLLGEALVLIVLGVGVYYVGEWLAGRADENATARGNEEEKTTVVMKGKKRNED